MTIQILRPNSQVFRSNWVDASGNTTGLNADVSDDSDATYVVATTGYPAGIARLNVGMGTITTPSASQRILRVRIRIRNAETSESGTSAFQQVSATVKVPTMSPVIAEREYFKRFTTTITTQDGMWRSVAPNGTEWTKSAIDQVEIELYGYKSSSGAVLFQRVHELYLDVDVRDRASVSAVTVTGMGTTSRPTVDWTYTANADGDAQAAYQVRVFSLAQYSVANFDPETSPATWDSGTVHSASTMTTVGADLINTTSYKFYVRAASDFNGSLWWTDFASSATEATAYEPVPAPTLTVTPDTTVPNLRNLLQITANLNLLSAQDASFEDSTLGTGSWAGVNNAVPTRTTAQATKGVASMSMAAVATTSSPQGPTTLGTIGPGTGSGGALTSASFTPAANSLLITVAHGDSPATTVASAAITDSVGGSWTQIDLANYTDGSRPGYIQAWWKFAGASPAAQTVTLDDSSGGTMFHGGWVEQWTGTHTTTPIGAVATNVNGGGGDPAARTISITTANDHSRVAGGFSNYNSCTFTATGTNEQITNQQSVSGTTAGCSMCKTVETSPAGATSLTVTRSGSISEYHLIAWEIRGAAASGTGDIVVATSGGTAGYPVLPNRAYTWLGSFRAATTGRSCRLEADFFDHNGVAVGTLQTGSNISDVTGSWTQATLTATTPAAAAYARLYARVLTPGASEVHYLDAVSMSTSSSTTWFSGGFTDGDLLVVEYADATPMQVAAVNLAHPQLASGGEALGSTDGFVVRSAKDLVTLEPALAQVGESSVRWDVGNASGSLLDIGTALGVYDPTYALPAVPGTAYTLSAYVRALAGTHSLRLVATSIDSAGAVVGSASTGTPDTTVVQAWERITVTHTAQTNAVAIRLALDNVNGDLATYFVDAVQHEEGSSATAWRPGEGLTPSWSYVRGARTALTTDSRSNSAAVWDREAPPGVIRYYRASTVVVQADGTTVASSPTAPVAAKLAVFNDVSGILKDPTDAGSALTVRLEAVNSQISEDATELRLARPHTPGGRGQRPAVLSDWVGGDDGELTIGVTSDADWQRLEGLLRAQRPLLLQLVGGGQRYIRLRGRSWPQESVWPGGVRTWKREITVPFVECDRPPVLA